MVLEHVVVIIIRILEVEPVIMSNHLVIIIIMMAVADKCLERKFAQIAIF